MVNNRVDRNKEFCPWSFQMHTKAHAGQDFLEVNLS